jgi:hypothetical protein
MKIFFRLNLVKASAFIVNGDPIDVLIKGPEKNFATLNSCIFYAFESQNFLNFEVYFEKNSLTVNTLVWPLKNRTPILQVILPINIISGPNYLSEKYSAKKLARFRLL